VPLFTDVSYGPHKRNTLDFWRAPRNAPAPVLVWFHGGGFYQGSKDGVSGELLVAALGAGFHVASVEYRLADQSPYPAAFEDGARAIQFLRWRAANWGIDPSRIAAVGASAGGGIALWLGYHEDLADRASDDPIARQSSRPACMACLNAQSSYDPHFIRANIPGPTWRGTILQRLFAAAPEDFDKPELMTKFVEASPINHVSRDDPPTFLFYSQPDTPPSQEVPAGPGIHHVRFGQLLKAKLDAAGVECLLRSRTDYPNWTDPQMWPLFSREAMAFLKRHPVSTH
jgi:acetyl esterase